jgi:phage terminase small subunit
MNLSIKELKFVQEYLINGFNGKRAYMAAYETDNENMASVQACVMLKKPKILKALDEEEGGFKELARTYGAEKKNIVKKLIEHMNEGDRKESIAAITTLMKLTGDFAPEKKEVKVDEESKIDIENMTDKQLEDLKKNLLSNM